MTKAKENPFNPLDLWEIRPKQPKMRQKMIFGQKYLHIRKKSSTFAKSLLITKQILQCPNVYVAMGGYKATQEKDIRKLKKNTLDFPETFNT